jgi:hypothetical protein
MKKTEKAERGNRIMCVSNAGNIKLGYLPKRLAKARTKKLTMEKSYTISKYPVPEE